MKKFIVDSMNFETNPIYLIILITAIMSLLYLSMIGGFKCG